MERWSFIAIVTGLRVSELLALRWRDINWEKMEIDILRGIVHQVVGDLKTEASQKPLPIDSGLAEVLADWRAKTPYNAESDWVFASPAMHVVQPYWPDSVWSKVIQPAAKRAGLTKAVGWHRFKKLRDAAKRQRGRCESCAGTDATRQLQRVTLDTYVQADTGQKRAAQGKLSGLCLFHAHPKLAAELGREGGRQSRATLLPDDEQPQVEPPRTAADVRTMLSSVTAEICAGKIDSKRRTKVRP